MNQETASQIAISGLAFMAGDKTHLERFLSLTGTDVSDLRTMAQSGEFFSAVLEYFLGDEPALLEFTTSQNLKPEDVQKAHRALTGNEGATALP